MDSCPLSLSPLTNKTIQYTISFPRTIQGTSHHWHCHKQPLNKYTGLVPDDTVHKGTTPPFFGTRSNLILDIAIAPYSIYNFLYLFSLFYSTGEPALGLSHCSKRGLLQKIMAVDSTAANTGILFLFFFLFCLDRQGCQSTSPYRSAMVAIACTQCCCHNAAGPRTQPGLPSGHSTYWTAGDSGWHRPSGRWNTAVLVSCY